MQGTIQTGNKLSCYHCGTPCEDNHIHIADKNFCCEGCKTVYKILQQVDLCDYYDLNKNPGINQRVKIRQDKFAFLDDQKIRRRLIDFEDDKNVHVTFYLPQMHCSSCLYLLENMHRINPGVVSSKVNFARKEVQVVYGAAETTLREVAESFTHAGYEPYISLNDLKEKRLAPDKSMVYQLGVAGFCFGNIMLMSFPEYLGIDASDTGLRATFRWLNFGLAIPVFLYSALPFYRSSIASLRNRYLHIDAPIALAIVITFIRSAWEVISGTGGGYFDSMTGIVFFMLAGRILQNKTYRQLSFERDYTSYFPVAISVVKDGQEIPTELPDIKTGDTLLIHNEELIPADGILTKGKALIDYSFVTGESLPVLKEMGEIVYAGGKQTGGSIEVLTIKEVSQSYLTKLWTQKNDEPAKENKPADDASFVHLLSRYFTYIVLTLALATGIYWGMTGSEKLWPAVTSIFIVACPCALLLSSTFTNGNILRILGRNQFYLKDAATIEKVSRITHIVFDKTGTLTNTREQEVSYTGNNLSDVQKQQVASVAACSSHPLSKALRHYLGQYRSMHVDSFVETAGKGTEGFIAEVKIKIGSAEFVGAESDRSPGTNVFVSIGDSTPGYFTFHNRYREQVIPLLKDLKKRYRVSVLSGDNDSERAALQEILGKDSTVLFNQKPEDKLRYILQLQRQGEKVMMIGDGLNDAGALKQSDAGVAVSDQTNNFTPASNAIVQASGLPRLAGFMKLCRINRRIIIASFVLSILYNIIGLSFAVQGTLSPLVAAILMPSSSLSILLLTFGASRLAAKRLSL